MGAHKRNSAGIGNCKFRELRSYFQSLPDEERVAITADDLQRDLKCSRERAEWSMAKWAEQFIKPAQKRLNKKRRLALEQSSPSSASSPGNTSMAALVQDTNPSMSIGDQMIVYSPSSNQPSTANNATKKDAIALLIERADENTLRSIAHTLLQP